MTDRGWIGPIVERVVTQVLESHTAQLREEIVRRVREEIAAQPASEEPAPAASTNSIDLARAVADIQLGTSQKEILKALLDGCAHHAARVVLFVVKGSSASGWQSRGFASNDAIKDFGLDIHATAVARALADRVVVSAPVSDFDSHFIQQFGAPSGEGHILPLVLKDKVAALVYADCGPNGGLLDAAALELMVLSTGAWLEVNTLRKQTHANVHAAEPVPAPVAQSAPAFNDPFSSHAPAHAMAAAATAQAVPATSAAAEAEPVAIESAPVAVADAPPAEAVPPDAASIEEQEIHRKAQRFARLLVDEVKLYNQAKVAEGRKHKDLYDRLKEAIEKSRSTYQKRYGNTVAASGNYFQHEVVRSLAEDDVSIMGSNFQH